MQLPTIEEISAVPFKKKIKEKLLQVIVELSALPALPAFLVLRYAFRIKFIRLRSDRIGHLSANTEQFLRSLQLGTIPSLRYIALATKPAANEALLTMYKRYLTVLQFPQPSFIRVLIKLLSTRSVLRRTDCIEAIPFDEFSNVWNSGVPTIILTPLDEENGKILLNKMNVDSWFVCFHARDEKYLQSKWKKGDWQHTHRNCSIDNFAQAAQYVGSKGGYALRMGSVVEKALSFSGKHIIDYATSHRTEFGDITLMAKCKFFLGNTAGLVCVSYIFNVPNITTTLQLLAIPPVGAKDLFIPKKMWSEKEHRFLTFKEMIQNPVLNFMSARDFDNAGLRFIENSPEEILAVTREMNERIDGAWLTTAEDEQLQRLFISLYVEGKSFGVPQGRIGAQFLSENKNLL